MKHVVESSATHLTGEFNSATEEMEHRIGNTLRQDQIHHCLKGNTTRLGDTIFVSR